MRLRLFLLPLVVLYSLLAGSTAWAQDEYWEYSFRPGDTIWSIAKRYTTSVDNWREIQRINNIGQGPDRTIQPGTRIRIPVAMLKQQPIPAIVLAVQGDARVVRSDGSSAILEVGSKLYAGDRAITADEQNLRLQFADKSELQIQANSEVILDKLSYHGKTGMVDTRMRLQRGRVNTWVQKLKPSSRYQIQTPAAITAVRGTSYRLSNDENNISRTEVTEGLVGVSAGGVTQQVESGFGLVAEPGKPLAAPVKLLEAPQPGPNQSTAPGELYVAWADLDGAAQYRYQLATEADFDQLLYDNATNESRLSFSGLAPGTYHLQVRAIDANRLEGLNGVRSYQVTAAPAGPGAAESVIIPSGVLILGQ